MTVELTLRYINAQLFKVFLISVFFLYYETRFIPGAIHSWIVVLGLLVLMPIACSSLLKKTARVSYDYLFIGAILLIIFLGFLINFSTATWINTQAYILMLLTYIYVKESTTESTLDFILKILRTFLVINGILVIAQLVTGEFFPARYIATGNPPLIIPSGVSDGPTKNGFLVVFGVSALIANFFFKRLTYSHSDALIILLGAISLFASGSRAAIVSAIGVFMFGILFALVQSIKDKRFTLSSRVLIMFPALLGGIIYFNVKFGWELSYVLGDFSSSTSGMDLIKFKIQNFIDDSALERLKGYDFLTVLMQNMPFQFFTLGIGAGSFETLYGSNIHNSWMELFIVSGLIGFVIFLSLNIYVIVQALKSNVALYVTPLMFSLLSIMIFMMAHDILRGRIYWVALGIIAGYTHLSKKRRSIDSDRCNFP